MTPVKTKSRGLLYILRSHDGAYFRLASLLALKVFICPTTQWLKDWIREAKACRFGWIFLSYSKQGLTFFILGIIWHLPPKTHKKYSADNFLVRKVHLPLELKKIIRIYGRRLPFLPNAKQAMAAFLEAHCTQRMCSCVYWALHNGWKKTKTRLSQLKILVTEKLTSPVRTGLLHFPVSPQWRCTASHCTLSTGGHCVENVQIRVEWKSSVSCLRLQCHGCTARSSEHRRNHRRCTNSNTEPLPQLHAWQCKIWQLYIIANGTQLTSHLVVKTFKNTKAHCIKC